MTVGKEGRRLLPPAVLAQRVIAVLRGEDATASVAALRAAGVDVLEVTLTTPDALALIEDLAGDGVCVGAGSVRTAQQARDAVDAGAGFLVSPVVDVEVVSAAEALGTPMVPGALSPSEIEAAWQAGAAAVKLFPAHVLGPGYLASVLAPMPDVLVIPTGGIDDRAARAWLEAGAAAVGAGGWLTADPDGIADRAHRLLAAARPEGG